MRQNTKNRIMNVFIIALVTAVMVSGFFRYHLGQHLSRTGVLRTDYQPYPPSFNCALWTAAGEKGFPVFGILSMTDSLTLATSDQELQISGYRICFMLAQRALHPEDFFSNMQRRLLILWLLLHAPVESVLYQLAQHSGTADLDQISADWFGKSIRELNPAQAALLAMHWAKPEKSTAQLTLDLSVFFENMKDHGCVDPAVYNVYRDMPVSDLFRPGFRL